jgi:hypothetical protein
MHKYMSALHKVSPASVPEDDQVDDTPTWNNQLYFLTYNPGTYSQHHTDRDGRSGGSTPEGRLHGNAGYFTDLIVRVPLSSVASTVTFSPA